MELVSFIPWLLAAAIGFFAAGWLFARIDLKQLRGEKKLLPDGYFRGVNFLLNNQQDKALEALLEATHDNPDALELQFALGSLFRRRGEIDRALRTHKSLSERTGISAEQRTTALYELALDYQRSGLLDHAEEVLVDLRDRGVGTREQREQVLKLLLSLNQQDREWTKAVDAATALDTLCGGNQDHRVQIANYHCESAIEAHASGDSSAAFTALDAALAANPACVRANLLRGDWLLASGQPAEAIAVWHRIEQQDPAFLGLAADSLLAAYEAQGEAAQVRGYADLFAMQQQFPALDLLNALFRATLATKGPEAAYQLVKDDLRHNPTLVGLDRLLEAQVLAAPPERKQDLEMLKALVHSHAARLAVYLCRQCGFKAKQYYWQCPACLGWETFPPRRTAEYDTAERHLARFHIEDRPAQ